MSVKISVTGIAEIDQVLRGLPQQLQHKILSEAHAEAAQPLVKMAYYKAPLRTGRLAESIGVKKTNLGKVGAIGLVQVGPIRGGSKKGYHAHLIEYGHRLVRGGKQIGFVRAKPFMEPSFNATKDIVESNIASTLGKRLLAFMKRTVKKYA